MKSPTGQYTYRQDVMTFPTRHRVGDVYCTASCRSTMTSPKLLTNNSTTRCAVGIASRVFDKFLGKKEDQVQTNKQFLN